MATHGFSKITRFEIEGDNPTNTDKFGENPDWRIEEKVDGSNFWFYVTYVDEKYNIFFGNKMKVIKGPPSGVWAESMLAMMGIKHLLNPKYVYYGESITKSRHGSIKYHRPPPLWVVLYDIKDMSQDPPVHLSRPEIEAEAERLGLMPTQVLYDNTGKDGLVAEIAPQFIRDIEAGKITSCLGGEVEGIIIKHPNFKDKGKISYRRMKLVTAKYKEQAHAKKPKAPKPDETYVDLLTEYGKSYAVDARFVKGYDRIVAANRNKGNKGKIMSVLIADLNEDLLEEEMHNIIEYVYKVCQQGLEAAYEAQETCFQDVPINHEHQEAELDRVKQMLFHKFAKDILAGSTHGLSEWYDAHMAVINAEA